MQTLALADRLYPEVLSGEKTNTIRWREPSIEPGLMRYICDDDPSATVVVTVLRSTDMPLRDAAAFVGKADEWPDDVMLGGMRAHYPTIELSDIVQVIEHERYVGTK